MAGTVFVRRPFTVVRQLAVSVVICPLLRALLEKSIDRDHRQSFIHRVQASGLVPWLAAVALPPVPPLGVGAVLLARPVAVELGGLGPFARHRLAEPTRVAVPQIPCFR